MAGTDGAAESGGSGGVGGHGGTGNDSGVSAEAEASVGQAMSDANDAASNASDDAADDTSVDTAPDDDMTEEDAVATQERMEAEGRAAKSGFEASAEAEQEAAAAEVAAGQSYADAMDQEVAAQNAAAEAQAEAVHAESVTASAATAEIAQETAVAGTFADSHVSQGLSGLNEGIANVLGGPVDVVEMGLNGIMAAAEFLGVPESMTPEFSNSFLGSDHIAGMMTDFGSIGPESADPAKQATRDVAEVTTEVVSAVIGAGLAARGASVGQVVDDIVVDTRRAVDLDLTYMPGWSVTQRAAADAKAAALTQADTVVTTVERSSTSLRGQFTREVGDIPANADLDHIQDLQLGGVDDIVNMGPLDASVNRSLGAQINHQIRDLEVGTPVGTVTMGER